MRALVKSVFVCPGNCQGTSCTAIGLYPSLHKYGNGYNQSSQFTFSLPRTTAKIGLHLYTSDISFIVTCSCDKWQIWTSYVLWLAGWFCKMVGRNLFIQCKASKYILQILGKTNPHGINMFVNKS